MAGITFNLIIIRIHGQRTKRCNAQKRQAQPTMQLHSYENRIQDYSSQDSSYSQDMPEPEVLTTVDFDEEEWYIPGAKEILAWG